MFPASTGPVRWDRICRMTPGIGQGDVWVCLSIAIRKITIEVQPILATDRKAVDEAAIEGLQRQGAFE